MSEPTSFSALMKRVKLGEASAAEEMMRQYEATVRRAIRVRLINPSLRRAADSMDLMQSVMGSFFIRTALGQYELGSPEQLIGLLVQLAHNKVADHVRREHAQIRDRRRTTADAAQLDLVAARQETPSAAVAGAEVLDRFRARLGEAERYLAEQRAQGRAWDDLAAELGQSAEALRKQLQRAVDRVAVELGIEL